MYRDTGRAFFCNISWGTAVVILLRATHTIDTLVPILAGNGGRSSKIEFVTSCDAEQLCYLVSKARETLLEG